MRAYLRSLNPGLPAAVYNLQAGGLVNAVGNGLVFPFTLIYLHNVRGISLGVAGLILATNALMGMVTGPFAGALVDRVGGKAMLAASLVVFAVGYAGLTLVHEAWQGFLAMAIVGTGHGMFWPAQSTLITGLTAREQRTSAFAMQRVMMNLGIGIGAVIGGLIASTERPGTFTVVLLLNVGTFLAYLAVLLLRVPDVQRGHGEGPPGSYATVLRNRAFVWVFLLNTGFIFAGMAGFELLPPFAKNEAGVAESAIGLVFLVNTLVIVVAQLPVAKAVEGHRRMRMLGLLGGVWALAWALVPLADGMGEVGAVLLLAGAVSVFAIGECLHGAVQAPLVADLAEPGLIGRYMALSALSWQVGFALGPGIGGFVLDASPSGLWLGAAALCFANGLAALWLERALPQAARRTPVAAPA